MNSRSQQRTYPNIINIDINMQLGYFSRDIYLSSRGHQRGAAWCWRAGCGTWAPPTIINYCLHNFSMCPDCPRPSLSHTRDIFPRFPAFRLLRGANVLQFVDLKLSKVHSQTCKQCLKIFWRWCIISCKTYIYEAIHDVCCRKVRSSSQYKPFNIKYNQ